jgi:outer membrane protein
MVRLILLPLALVGFTISSAVAAETKVAVFDMQNAIQTVAEGKKARDSLKKDWEVRQAKLKKKEEKIQAAMEEFKKQSLVLDEKARAAKEMEIRNQMVELQQEGMGAQREFQEKDQKMSGPILTKLRKIVGEVSKAKGYAIVLDKNENAVLFFEPAHDLTDEVIKKYDATK